MNEWRGGGMSLQMLTEMSQSQVMRGVSDRDTHQGPSVYLREKCHAHLLWDGMTPGFSSYHDGHCRVGFLEGCVLWVKTNWFSS